MFHIILTIHIVLCVFLVTVVLLQQGKGADAGVTFGGGSNTFFGASGAGSILTKATTSCAILFMVTSIALIRTYPDRIGVVNADTPLSGSVFEGETEKATVDDVAAEATGKVQGEAVDKDGAVAGAAKNPETTGAVTGEADSNANAQAGIAEGAAASSTNKVENPGAKGDAGK